MNIPSHASGNMSCDSESDDPFDDRITIFGGFTFPYYTFEDGRIFETA
jgi:hypothetical protein